MAQLLHQRQLFFFESACMLLHSLSIRPDLTAAQLRADVVQYLRLCPGSTQDLPERILIEMSDELSVPLVCSTRGRLNDTRLDGFVPTSSINYNNTCVHKCSTAEIMNWNVVVYTSDQRSHPVTSMSINEGSSACVHKHMNATFCCSNKYIMYA